MSITYDGAISVSAVTWRDGATDTTQNQVYIVESSSSTMRKYDLSTRSQVGSNINTLSTPSAITLATNLSSVIVSSAVTTVDIIENSSGYRTNIAGGLATGGTVKNQQIAGDTSTGICIAATNTTNTLVKVNANTQTVSQLSILGSGPSFTFTTVILKSAGRWLVGGNNSTVGNARIFEIDANGTIYDEMPLPMSPNGGTQTTSNVSAIAGMAYDTNILTIATADTVFIYDWTTKAQLYVFQTSTSSASDALILSNAASGECLLTCGVNTTPNNSVFELDFSVNPGQIKDSLFLTAINSVTAAGINTANNKGWALQNTATPKIHVFTITPRDTRTRTVTVQNGGSDVKCRLIWLDDTSSPAQLIFDTIMQSPATYRIPSNKTIVEIIKYGEGTTALWDLSRYTT